MVFEYYVLDRIIESVVQVTFWTIEWMAVAKKVKSVWLASI